MTDVIDFLERLGRDASLRRVPLESALQGAGLSADSLETVLGVANVCCLINAPAEQQEMDVPVKKDAARAA